MSQFAFLHREWPDVFDTFRRAASQIDFVNLIVNQLTEHGTMDAAQLYASPFTDLTPRGPEGLFTETAVQELVSVLDAVKRSAVAA